MLENMSSDRMMACRIFDGEIHRIKSLYENTPQWTNYSHIIQYLESRIKSMKEREHSR
jgi:hypothetical protein